MKTKAFTLIELLVVVAIIGILAAVGVVAYNGYTKSAKEKVTESNFNNINKALVLEFMNCELDSSKLIFNNHSCSNSNAPSANLIGNYITGTLKIKNPYGSSLINSNPCNQGTVSISTPSKGNYSVSSFISSSKNIATHTIGTTWTPIKVSGSTTYKTITANTSTGYKTITATANACYKQITANTSAGYKKITPGSSGSYKQIKP
ncbi:type II secretion system protein [Candidatus Pelagibacter sp. Uisw_101]|jgi:prepilin-type N-terminal cleavage/methylation domain-containing protein|uniref:type II secretion system protein n=1 Tax=Candidatus Pelagibacter sp. Uisw_101 TaxID=3230982 RepID=UPI0039EA192A